MLPTASNVRSVRHVIFVSLQDCWPWCVGVGHAIGYAPWVSISILTTMSSPVATLAAFSLDAAASDQHLQRVRSAEFSDLLLEKLPSYGRLRGVRLAVEFVSRQFNPQCKATEPLFLVRFSPEPSDFSHFFGRALTAASDQPAPGIAASE